MFLLKNGSRYQYEGNRTVADLKDFINGGYLRPKPKPANVTKLPVPEPQPEPNANETNPLPGPQPEIKKNGTQTVPKNNTETPTIPKTITVTTQSLNSQMNNSDWFKVLMLGSLFIGIGMFIIIRNYLKQNEDFSKQLDPDENNEELEEASRTNVEKEALKSSKFENSVIGIEMTGNI